MASGKSAKMPLASCVLVFGPRDLILAVPRKNDPSKFGLPGGKVERGETFEEAAIRETAEETAYRVRLLWKAYEGVCEGEVPHLTATYLATIVGDAPPTPESHRYEWVTWAKLMKGPFAAYNKMVRKAYETRMGR